ANYSAGSGSKDLTFTYTVVGADNDTNGITVASSINLNTTGTLTYVGPNGLTNCDLSLEVPSTSSIRVDNTGPTVASVTAPANGTYYLNMPMNFTVNMSEATYVTGTP